MKYFIIGIFFLLISKCYGQSKREIYISTNPFYALDSWHGPNINSALELRYDTNQGVRLGVQYYYPQTHFIGYKTNNWIHLSGYRLIVEYRRYNQENSNENTTFWGIQLDYGQQYYKRTDTIVFHKIKKDIKYLKAYNNKRQFINLTACYGGRIIMTHRLQLIISFGIGIRYNYVLNNLTKRESENRALGDWTNPAYWIQLKGKNIRPRFTVGLRLTYRL